LHKVIGEYSLRKYNFLNSQECHSYYVSLELKASDLATPLSATWVVSREWGVGT
jgi:hypothetical protein